MRHRKAILLAAAPRLSGRAPRKQNRDQTRILTTRRPGVGWRWWASSAEGKAHDRSPGGGPGRAGRRTARTATGHRTGGRPAAVKSPARRPRAHRTIRTRSGSRITDWHCRVWTQRSACRTWPRGILIRFLYRRSIGTKPRTGLTWSHLYRTRPMKLLIVAFTAREGRVHDPRHPPTTTSLFVRGQRPTGRP